MGKVVFDDPVHHISGRISKKYRTCYNYRKWSDRKYTSVHGDRTTPTASEVPGCSFGGSKPFYGPHALDVRPNRLHQRA